MRHLFGCPDIVSLTEKFLMARNFYRIFTENNPVMGDSKTFGIPEAKGLTKVWLPPHCLWLYMYMCVRDTCVYYIVCTCAYVSVQCERGARVMVQNLSLVDNTGKITKGLFYRYKTKTISTHFAVSLTFLITNSIDQTMDIPNFDCS